MEMEKIVFKTEDGEELSLFVLEETTFQGQRFLLASETSPMDEDDSDELEVYVLKQDSSEDEEEVYSLIEDDQLLDSVMEIFGQMYNDDAEN